MRYALGGEVWEGANRTYRHRRHDGGASAKTATTTTTTSVDDDDNWGYWVRAYHAEEADATRDTLSRSEHTSMTFDVRSWFSSRSFRNQPDNMRDVLPMGLRESAGKVVFETNGMVRAPPEAFGIWRDKWVGLNRNGDVDDGGISQVLIKTKQCHGRYTIHRTLDWGWELRGSDYILRAMDGHVLDDDRGDEHRDDYILMKHHLNCTVFK